jgi:hypothetical protein
MQPRRGNSTGVAARSPAAALARQARFGHQSQGLHGIFLGKKTPRAGKRFAA